MLKSYASYFVSYLLSNFEDVGNIERIVLFGSVARDEAEKESDVDIFIEVKKETVKFDKGIKKLEERFYESRETALFKAKGIENKINLKIGKLKEWEDLYKSVASTGIVLYGRYEAKELPSGVNHFVIIFWNKIGKNRGALLNRLYGFSVKGKHYSGLLENFKGKKLGKSCIMIPVQYKNDVFKLLKDYKAEAKAVEVFG